MHDLKIHSVWDAGTRWFHWINVLCIVGLAAIGIAILNDKALGVTDDGKILLKTVHVLIGYVFAANLFWRFVWAFFGNRHARWDAFLPCGRGYGEALRSYLAAGRGGHPQQYLGHNPLGRLAVTILLAVLAVQGVTGLILAGTDLFYPPLGSMIAGRVAASGVDPATLVPYAPELYDADAYAAMRELRKPVVATHEYVFFALLFLIVAHVAAVIVTELREGGTLISAMFTGRKIIRGRAADEPADTQVDRPAHE